MFLIFLSFPLLPWFWSLLFHIELVMLAWIYVALRNRDNIIFLSMWYTKADTCDMTITKGPPTFNLGTIVRIHLINHFIYKLTLSSHYFSCHIYLLKSCYYLLIVIIRVFVEILPSSFLPLALKHAPYSFLCKFFLKWIIRGFLFGFVFGL